MVSGLPHADSKGAWLVCCTYTCTCTVNTLMVFMSKDYHSSFKCLITSEVTNVHVLLGPPTSRTRATRARIRVRSFSRVRFTATPTRDPSRRGNSLTVSTYIVHAAGVQDEVQEGDLHCTAVHSIVHSEDC